MVSIVCEKEPKIFSQLNKEQKKTLVRLFDLIIENGDTNSLYKILDQVIDLDDDERDELAELLDKSSMSNITKTIKLIQDRYKAVAELKELVFNPDLKANENFLSLQSDLKETEDKITYARQFYNDSAMSFNNIVEMFPSNIIAGMFKFKIYEYFKIDEKEKGTPKVKF